MIQEILAEAKKFWQQVVDKKEPTKIQRETCTYRKVKRSTVGLLLLRNTASMMLRFRS